MRSTRVSMLAGIALATASMAQAQSGHMSLPTIIAAGSAFSIPTNGSGKAVLYIVGPGQAIRRDVQLGEAASFPAGDLFNAGHYMAILVASSSTDTGVLDVAPASQPQTLNFLAKPSRLSVGLHNGISGAVYIFDAYLNLITTPMPVSLELFDSSGAVRSRSVTTRDGLAWAEMDSATKQGTAKFIARAGQASSTRIIDEVPGDACGLTISARANGERVEVLTAPVRDCSGNPIPDGTIVTFTETFNSMQSTVDVPLKRGVARVDMPAYNGAKFSVASGVVAGNEIRWEKGR